MRMYAHTHIAQKPFFKFQINAHFIFFSLLDELYLVLVLFKSLKITFVAMHCSLSH